MGAQTNSHGGTLSGDKGGGDGGEGVGGGGRGGGLGEEGRKRMLVCVIGCLIDNLASVLAAEGEDNLWIMFCFL
jgi:hypothetical protein